MTSIRFPEFLTQDQIHFDSPEVTECKVDALVDAMTLDEKLSMLGGSKEPECKGKVGNAGYLWGVPRLGIPEIVMYDGPAGITGIVDTTGLPQPGLLGCTFDDDMAYAFGKVAATETQACSGNFVLAPQVDVIRSPHFGRNKDMKSEDSYLASRMAVAEIQGMQENGAVGTLKHYVAANLSGENASSYPRSIIDEQTLHEVYLRPFRWAVRKGSAGCIMNAYNYINDDYMSANRHLNEDVLRGWWGFKGAMMSDWGSVHKFTLNKGMDIEMPFPAYNDRKHIFRHLRKGDYSFDEIDHSVRRILHSMAAAGLLSLVELDGDGKAKVDENHPLPIQMAWNYEEAKQNGLLERNAAVCRDILREGIVLMKNDDHALPLTTDDLENTVLCGLGAKYPVCGEAQERSYGTLSRMIPIGQALEEITGKHVESYPGIDYVGDMIPASCFYQDETLTLHGLKRTWGILDEDRSKEHIQEDAGGAGAAFNGFIGLDEEGEEVDTGLGGYHYNAPDTALPEGISASDVYGVDDVLNFTVGTEENGHICKHWRNGLNGTAFTDGVAFTWDGVLVPEESGEYIMQLQCIGGQGTFLMQIDGSWQVIGKNKIREWAQWPWESIICTPEGMGIVSAKVTLEAGKTYPITVFARQCVKDKDLQIRAAWITPSRRERDRKEAMDAVRGADTVIWFAHDSILGNGDMHAKTDKGCHLTLADEQKALLQEALSCRKAGSRFIVVLQTSNARAIGEWADDADAIINTYMPGQEGTRVLAEILMGVTNPSGRLNQSWPRCSEDTPLTDTPLHCMRRDTGFVKNGEKTIEMSEGIFTGYRWHDRFGVKPMYAFGHGLSYTTFDYKKLDVVEDEDTFTVICEVTNTGALAGDEVVQLYLGKGDVPEFTQMAEKQLVGYNRVKNMKPGETRRIEMTIEPEMLCCWNVAEKLSAGPDGSLGKWDRVLGERQIFVGAASDDIRLTTTICVK